MGGGGRWVARRGDGSRGPRTMEAGGWGKGEDVADSEEDRSGVITLSYQMSRRHNTCAAAHRSSEQQPWLEKQRSVGPLLTVLQLQLHARVAPD